jgi:hypothetical protein
MLSDNSLVSPFDISKKNLVEAIEYQKENDFWVNTPHEGMNKLAIDQSGKIGERTFYQWCLDDVDIKIDYDENNTDQPDGIYEGSISLAEHEPILVTINNPKYRGTNEQVYRLKYRYENKTARLGADKRFQHENIKPKEFCDLIVFMDYTPHEIYLTILTTDFDYTKKHPILGITPHHRKEENGYKIDFGPAQIRRGIAAGITMKIENDTPIGDVHNFIKKFLV